MGDATGHSSKATRSSSECDSAFKLEVCDDMSLCSLISGVLLCIHQGLGNDFGHVATKRITSYLGLEGLDPPLKLPVDHRPPLPPPMAYGLLAIRSVTGSKEGSKQDQP